MLMLIFFEYGLHRPRLVVSLVENFIVISFRSHWADHKSDHSFNAALQFSSASPGSGKLAAAVLPILAFAGFCAVKVELFPPTASPIPYISVS